MLMIQLRFPGGRYHATPWGMHVNEGEVEWPPSSWRICRALLAVGYATEGWDKVPALAESLVGKLAAVLPEYFLPPAQLAQTRHYMPLAILDGGREKTTLVFDTWARVDGPLTIRWNTALTEEESALLTRLVSRLGYLGRAESRVEACILPVDSGDEPPGTPCRPEEGGEARGPGWEQVSLLAPMPSSELLSWLEAARAEAQADLPSAASKEPAKLKKEREKRLAPFPSSLVDALQKDTRWVKSHGWSQPPGARRVLYWRRTDALEVGRPLRPRARALPQRVESVLLALTAPSGNPHVLPSDVRALPQAELLHRDLVGYLCRRGTASEAHELIGNDATRQPLKGHLHGHILPLDLDGDRHLDHILVWAPGGIGAAGREALRQVRQTYTKGGAEPLRLAVAFEGALELLRGLPHDYQQAIAAVLGPQGGARVWQTVTPFLCPRFLKPRGKNTLAGQLQAELKQRGLPPAEVTVLELDAQVRLRHFVRLRQHGGAAPPSLQGWAVQLRFERPVSGPLCLGYGSHFGLGQFQAPLDERGTA